MEANVIRCGDLTLRVTISFGVAERTPNMKSQDDLLREADNALYAAKNAGRNTVRLASTQRESRTEDPPPELETTLTKGPIHRDRV